MEKRNISLGGGWGFGRDDAVILSVPPRSRRKYCNTVPLESLVVRTRNEEEFSGFPPEGKRYAVVDYGRVSRTVTAQSGRMYAIWRGLMALVSEKDAPALYRKVSGLPLARRIAPAVGERVLAVPREYWFDVTDASTLNAAAAKATGSSPFVSVRP
jgi:hypothetical protein